MEAFRNAKMNKTLITSLFSLLGAFSILVKGSVAESGNSAPADNIIQKENSADVEEETSASKNGILNAASCMTPNAPSWCSGSDIFAWANAAYAHCSNACTVYIPGGTYTTSTTLNLPVITNGSAALWIDNAVTINYAGPGDAIFAASNQVGRVNLVVYGGGQIVGTSSGASGLHLGAFAGVVVRDLTVRGFTNGDGFLNQGTNTADFYSCHSVSNKNGVHNVGIVVGGNRYAANAIHWHGGHIDFNTNQGWWEDGEWSAVVGVNENNESEGVVYELNGTNRSATTANVFVQACFGCIFKANYFEYATSGEAPVNNFIIGDSTYQPIGTQIEDNTFISVTNTINNFNARSTRVEGNIEIAAPTTFFLQGMASPNGIVQCNDAPGAKNNIAGRLAGVISNCMPTASTAPGVQNLTSTGWATNGLTGYNQDLIIRTRTGGTLNIQGQSAAGTATYKFSDAGGFTPASTVVDLLPSAASNPGMILFVTDSTSVVAEGQTCTGNSNNKAVAISNGIVWKCF
jgi:hypothetical protein